MPRLNYYQPKTAEEAKAFEGAVVERWWEAGASQNIAWGSEWFRAEVTEVTHLADSKGVWVNIRYEADGDSEDLPWKEVFCRPRKTRVVSLPPAAAEYIQQLGHPSPVKSSSPSQRKRKAATQPVSTQQGASQQPDLERKPKLDSSSVVRRTQKATPASVSEPGRQKHPIGPSNGRSPDSQRRSNPRKSPPMSLTAKKRRLEDSFVRDTASDVSEDGSAQHVEAGSPDEAVASDSDGEEMRASDARIPTAGKRKTREVDAADQAAAEECARRAAGGTAEPSSQRVQPEADSPDSSGTAFRSTGLDTNDADVQSPPQKPPVRRSGARGRSRMAGSGHAARQQASQYGLQAATTQTAAVELDERYLGEVAEPDPIAGIGFAGQIARVRVENFMCHSNFEMELKPNIVFISGTNGSGKTAVMNAIQVCLGASARQTGRANSALAFVRTGARHAIAAVTIWNTGEDAYKPRTYGRMITVERRISANGSSTWKLMDQDGRKVGVGNKEQLDDLLNHLSIEASNPAVCMGQDACRQFASETSGKKKYELYMQATHFDMTIEKHAAADEHLAIMEERVQEFRERAQAKEKELKEVEDALAALQEVAPLKQLEEDLHNSLAWQHVHDQVRVVDMSREALEEKLPARVSELQATVDEHAQHVREAELLKASKEAALAQQRPHITEVSLRQGLLRDAVRNAALALREKRRSAQHAAAEVQEAAGALDAFAAEAAQQEAEFETNTQRAQQDFAEQLRQKRRQKEAAAADDSTARQQMRECEVALETAAKTAKDAAEDCKVAQRAVTDQQRELKALQDRQGNSVTAFGGPRVPQLLQRIEAAVEQGRFHHPPLGPLGSMLTLTDERWATAVEVAIGKMFDLFVVHDHHDLRIVKELARQSGMSVSCCVTSFDIPPHDLTQKEQPPGSLLTVLNVLQVQPCSQEHTIRNLLIDQKVERAALVESEDDALRLMRGPLGTRRVLTAAWSKDGAKAYLRGRTTSTLMRNHKRMRPRLTKDVAGAIEAVRRELRDAQDKADLAAARMSDARTAEREAKEAIAAAKRAHRQAVVRLGDSQAEETELIARGPELTGAESGALQQELANKRHQLAILQHESEEAAAALEEATRADERAKAELAGAQAEAADLMKDNKAVTEALQDSIKELAARKAEMELAQAQLAEIQGTLEQFKQQLVEYEKQLAELREQASQVCSEEEERESRERVRQAWLAEIDGAPRRGARRGAAATGPRTAQQVEEDLGSKERLSEAKDAVQSKIRECERAVGASLAELQTRRMRLAPEVEMHRAHLARISGIVSKTREGIRTRKSRFKELLKFSNNTLAARFAEFMRCRKFLGAVLINKREHTLDLCVSTDMRDANNSKWHEKADLKGLSGGERSYSTLAFTMALENVISVPFCCLDEFDVFMDPMNRTLGLKLLIEMSLENPTRQLILLSPQDISSVQKATELAEQHWINTKGESIPEGFVQIHCMKKARENATAS